MKAKLRLLSQERGVEVEIAPGGTLATYGAKVTKAGGLVATKRGTLKPGAPAS